MPFGAVPQQSPHPSPPGSGPLELVTDDGVALGAILDAGPVLTPGAPPPDPVLTPGAPVPRGVIVILPAMATPSRFYRKLSEHLAKAGWAVLRFDYRGVGLSRKGSLRGHPATMTDWSERDVEAALRYARERFAGLPLVLLGHSLGGQLVGISPSAHRVDAVVLVAAQSGWVGHWSARQRPRMELIWRVLIPIASRLAGYQPGWMGLGEDVPGGPVREWARWCLTRGYVTGALPAERLHFDRVRAPVLAWSFEDDDYAPAGATAELLSWYRAAQIEHRRLRPGDRGIPAIGHFGFFRDRAAPLWDETLAWLAQNVAGRG